MMSGVSVRLTFGLFGGLRRLLIESYTGFGAIKLHGIFRQIVSNPPETA